MMFIALIAPELMLAFAVRQLFVACWFAKGEYEVSSFYLDECAHINM
jgi:hypothetical protein